MESEEDSQSSRFGKDFQRQAACGGGGLLPIVEGGLCVGIKLGGRLKLGDFSFILPKSAVGGVTSGPVLKFGLFAPHLSL